MRAMVSAPRDSQPGGDAMRWTCETARDRYEDLKRRLEIVESHGFLAANEADRLRIEASNLLVTFTLPYPGRSFAAE